MDHGSIAYRNRKLLVLVQYGISLALATWAFDAVNRFVPDVYMDELFHVRQTQTYCDGHFDEWDPKITTPPGLYYLGWAYSRALKLPCNVLVLRGLNFFGGALVLPFLCSALVPGSGVEIASFPLLAFFASLYYTDVWSTIFVLMSIVCAKEGLAVMSAITGAASVLFRQTNIVWVAFLGAYIVASRCDDRYGGSDRDRGHWSQALWSYIDTALRSPTVTVPFAAVMAAFATFVYKNGSIALGDKDNHTTTLNVCQVLYFVLFWLFFTWPLWFDLKQAVRYYIAKFQNPKQLAIYGAQIAVLIAVQEKLVVVHPFLLADNRHYTFYLWRRVLPHTYLLAPVYQFGLEMLVGFLLKSRTPGILQIAYVLCVCACLIPSPLFEPRYYILPYIFWRVLFATSNPLSPSISIQSKSRVVFQWLWNMAINAITIYIFVSRPFFWEHETGKQRFMW